MGVFGLVLGASLICKSAHLEHQDENGDESHEAILFVAGHPHYVKDCRYANDARELADDNSQGRSQNDKVNALLTVCRDCMASVFSSCT